MGTIIEDAVVQLGPVCEDEAESIEVRLTAVDGTFDDGIVVSHADGARRSNLIVVENQRGKLVCRIYARKTEEDPTHEIEIEAAQYEEVEDGGGTGVAL